MNAYDGPANADPASLVVAYCAPGLAAYAARLLEDNGDVVREIIETQAMAGRTSVILATDPVFPLPADWTYLGPDDAGGRLWAAPAGALDRAPWANPWHDVRADLRLAGIGHLTYQYDRDTDADITDPPPGDETP